MLVNLLTSRIHKCQSVHTTCALVRIRVFSDRCRVGESAMTSQKRLFIDFPDWGMLARFSRVYGKGMKIRVDNTSDRERRIWKAWAETRKELRWVFEGKLQRWERTLVSNFWRLVFKFKLGFTVHDMRLLATEITRKHVYLLHQ